MKSFNLPYPMRSTPVSGVYSITCIPTGQVYIGASNRCWARKAHHFCELRLNRHANKLFQRLYNTYGPEAFEFKIERFCAPFAEVLQANEIEWQQRIGSKAISQEVYAGKNCGPLPLRVHN